MAFIVQACSTDDCGQLLYIEAVNGEQAVFCGKCHGHTVFTLSIDSETD